MSINLEKASIILEIISFFLVTIDLLGRKRIKVLQSRFEKLISFAKSIDITAIVVRHTFLNREKGPSWLIGLFLLPLAFGFALGSLFVWIYILDFLADFLGVPFLRCLAFPLAATTTEYLVTFLGLLMEKVGYFLVVMVEKIVDGIFTIILSLFNRLKLEGVMLIAGALLFLLSKALAYINASYR